VAFAGVAVIAACLAEVASYFQRGGRTISLRARGVRGDLWGIQIGWLTWLSRISACSGVANLFITYLTAFVPAAGTRLVRGGVLAVLIGFLAAVNYRGVTDGKWLSNFFHDYEGIAADALLLRPDSQLCSCTPEIRVIPAQVHAAPGDWFAAVLLMVYAYGGFEAALFASGEASKPAEGCAAGIGHRADHRHTAVRLPYSTS